MKTRTAFLLRFLLPPLYAAVVLTLIVALFEANTAANFPVYLGVFILYAYVFAGLPALLFSVLMGRFARRRPSLGGRLVRASILGLAAGVLITGMFGFRNPTLFLPLGIAVGFLVEGTVFRLEHRRSVAG